jgi:hypothetical protein
MIEKSFVKNFGTLHICDMNFKPCATGLWCIDVIMVF